MFNEENAKLVEKYLEQLGIGKFIIIAEGGLVRHGISLAETLGMLVIAQKSFLENKDNG